MKDKKKLLMVFSALIFFLFLTTLIPVNGTAAPSGKTFLGMDWGTKYWPTKPVRGGIFNTAGPLYIGMMNPFHIPVNDFTTMSYFYEKLTGKGSL